MFSFILLMLLCSNNINPVWLSTNHYCGKPRISEISARILGGTEVSPPHSQPWLVRVGRAFNSVKCSGSLISERHVLTAAHCEINLIPDTWRVILGDHDGRKKEKGEITLKIKSATKHPWYWLEGETAAYDYAIWTLEEPIKFSNTILPICLPNSPNNDYHGRKVINSGFGASSHLNNNTTPSMNWTHQVPRTVDLKVLPMSECKNAKWLSDRLDLVVTPGRDINETFMICAGLFRNDVKNKWIGPNRGDSGGIAF